MLVSIVCKQEILVGCNRWSSLHFRHYANLVTTFRVYLERTLALASFVASSPDLYSFTIFMTTCQIDRYQNVLVKPVTSNVLYWRNRSLDLINVREQAQGNKLLDLVIVTRIPS